MQNIFSYDSNQLLMLVLVLVRISGIFSTMPVLGSNNIPLQVKIVFILILGLIIYPFINFNEILYYQLSNYVILLSSELLIGLVLGLIGRFMFSAIEFAGTIIGFQMGLSMANVFDPTSEQQISMIARFETAIATLIFFVMDLHLMIIQAIVKSYSLIKPGQASVNNNLTEQIINFSSAIFSIGFQIGAPLIVALFLANMIIGLLSRSVPQIQVFIVGFPLILLLGFIFIMFGTPFFISTIKRMFEMLDNQLLDIIRLLKVNF